MVDVKSRLPRDIPSNPPLDTAPSDSAAIVGYLAAIAMTAVATILAVGIELGIRIPNLSLIFVVPVVIAGVGFGLGPSLCSALLGALAYNFFLTEPRYSLAVSDPANMWAIALLFVVGFIVSGVAYTSGRRAAEAAQRKRQAIALQGYSRKVLAADNTEALAATTCNALAQLFQRPAVVMLVAGGKAVSTKGTAGAEPVEAELDAALSSLATGHVSRAGVYPAVASRFDFWPVAAAAGLSAVIGLAFDPDERPSAPETVVDVVRNLLALALDRQHLRTVGADRSTR